ncbi:stage V sporulation protein AD [Chungangia koreensis]|uniref:Stage V sporulation protein AD n=1 Tax=Chungangia koreensis TaxID=752657 RepID=A0ABV8X1P7_9LACT
MVGKGTVQFMTKPIIAATGVTAGPLEKRKSSFSEYFDKTYDDERLDLQSNEQGHTQLISDACEIAMNKVGAAIGEADFLICGDLVNQMTPSNFAARQLFAPFIGAFSACATSVSSLVIAGLLTEVGMSHYALAGAASQHNAVERQFRYPIEYGTQKPPTSQWTVTAAGFAVVSPFKEGYPYLHRATIGRVIDYKLTDPLNMGAAMAPAAFDTLKRHLEANEGKDIKYDLIMTGDLGKVGSALLMEMVKQEELLTHPNMYLKDAGKEFYGDEPGVIAGASGAGCSAAAYFSEVYTKLMNKTYKRVLLIATGALLSPLSFQQGETIPCIAHAIELISE